jgi:flagellar biosynthetic protein FliR
MDAWAVSFSLILARVGAFVATQPLFGGQQVPRLIKAGFAVALATFWFGGLGPEAADLGSEISAKASWLSFSLAAARESLIGALLGFGLSILLMPIRTAGEYIGQEMGLSLASVANPMSSDSATLVGQLFESLGIALFLGLNGHHAWLVALHGTFARWPIGGEFPSVPVVPMTAAVARAHEWGLLLAVPLATCMFACSVLLALMARVAPQLNLISIGFSLRVGIGLLAAAVFVPDLLSGFCGVFEHFTEFLTRLV